MFHGVSMNMKEGGLLEQQLKEIYDSSRRMKSDIANAISSYVGLPLTHIEDLMINGGSIISAQEAKDRGFKSDIIEANIPANADIITISNV